MKDIDFLPEYFQDDRKRRIGLQRQCLFLCVIFLIMILSNALGSRSISKVRAELVYNEKQCTEAGQIGFEFARLKENMARIKSVQDLIAKLSVNPDIASIMAQLSELIPQNIVLEDLDITRKSAAYSADKSFFIHLQGRALCVSDITVLMRAMEESSGFSAVSLVYSKNMPAPEISKDNTGINTNTIEFKIRSVLVFQMK